MRGVADEDLEGKFSGGRWVDVNKGTKDEPKVRGKLVGQEFAHGERRDDLNVPTPPLASAHFLLSSCASRGKQGPSVHRILCGTSNKLPCTERCPRNVYIELLAADPMSEGKHWMNSARDAPAERQTELGRTVVKLGFRPVLSSLCLYCHSSLDVLVVGHVDDSMCVGPRSDLDTFLTKLMFIYDLA